jgi:hypothetical protein
MKQQNCHFYLFIHMIRMLILYLISLKFLINKTDFKIIFESIKKWAEVYKV